MEVSASFEELNAYLAHHSYLGDDAVATLLDYETSANVDGAKAKQFPHLCRWHAHVSHLVQRYGRSHDCYGLLVPKGFAPDFQGRTARLQPTHGQDEEALSTRTAVVGPSFFCILDFEKTCQDRDIDATFGPQEIIEFPSVLLARSSAQSVAEFESFVKPRVHPELTAFCTELTGIAQQHVDGAEALPEVLAKHHAWLRDLVPAEDACVFVTCGDMDLKRSLPEDPNVPMDVPACYRRWINIKKDFGAFYSQWYKKGKQARNMVEMLEKLGLELDGQHHSGIDDCRNIAKVLRKMLADGWMPRT